jgi:hypothetical protein
VYAVDAADVVYKPVTADEPVTLHL